MSLGDLEIQQVFECPRCGTQLGCGGADMRPPNCEFGHAPVEMEQKFPEALRAWAEPIWPPDAA